MESWSLQCHMPLDGTMAVWGHMQVKQITQDSTRAVEGHVALQ